MLCFRYGLAEKYDKRTVRNRGTTADLPRFRGRFETARGERSPKLRYARHVLSQPGDPNLLRRRVQYDGAQRAGFQEGTASCARVEPLSPFRSICFLHT